VRRKIKHVKRFYIYGEERGAEGVERK